MNEKDIVRTVTTRYKVEGSNEAVSSVRQVRTEMQAQASAADAVAVSTESSARRQLSAMKTLERMERQISAVVRAQFQFDKTQADMNRVISANPSLTERANAVLSVYAQRLDVAAVSAENLRRKQANASVNGGFGFNPNTANLETYADEVERAFAKQEALAASAAKLRAELNPLEAEQSRLAAQLMGYKEALDAGVISSEEYGAAQQIAGQKLADFSNKLNAASLAADSAAKKQRDAQLSALYREISEYQDGVAASSARLRAAMNPLEAEQAKIFAELSKYKEALDAGAISSDMYGAAQQIAGQKLADFSNKLNAAAIAADESAKKQKNAQLSGIYREVSEYQDRMAASAARLRASLNPLEAEQGRLAAEMNVLRDAMKAGMITAEQYGAAQKIAGQKLASAFPNEHFNKMSAAAEKLRRDLNPLEAEQGRLAAEMNVLRDAMKAGMITADQFSRAQVLAGKRLSDFAKNLQTASKYGRVMAGEMINLGYQLNDVVTGIALGQSPFMILAQQGGQVVQVFANSKSSIADFAVASKNWFVSLFTVGRAVFGGISVAIFGAIAALNSYIEAQKKVSLALTGAGRASGSTVGGINSIAGQASSTFGLSISEARDFATELAATGKVANDNILPIVKMGKDIATAFGVDAADAAKMLAQAFSDPAKGAETLNARLGFLDAATQRQIQNLTDQNRLYEAQRTLAAGVQSGLKGISDQVGTSTKFWTALGNSISNAWDKFGAWASRTTGIGLSVGLDDQLKAAQAKLAELEKQASQLEEINKRARFAFGASGPQANTSATEATTRAISEQRAEVDRLSKAMEQNARATESARQAQMSFAQASAIRQQQPEIAQIEQLRNQQELLVRTMINVQTTGGATSDILAKNGQSYEQLARALGIVLAKLQSFRSEYETTMASMKLQNQAITAFSPGAQAEVARQQSLLSTAGSNLTDPERKAVAEQAYANALKQSTVAISEQARARELNANQTIAAVQQEISAVGRTIGQQAELRANLQARQQLEQQASQSRTAFDQAEYDRLAKLNAEYGKLVQKLAEARLNSDIKFDFDTAFLSDADKQIASILRQTYGDDWKNMMDGPIAGAMRLNNMLSDVAQTVRSSAASFANDFVSGIMSGKSAADALRSSVQNLGKSLTSAGINNIFKDPTSPVGYVEAGVGLLAQLFGGADESKKKLEEAQRVWKEAGPAFQTFLKQMSGGVTGELAQRANQALQSYNELATAAYKAGDYAAVARLQAAYDEGRLRDAKNFVATFNATLQGLADGLGQNSPFYGAVNVIKQQLASVKNFVDDANTAFSTLNGIDINAAFVAGSRGPSPVSAEQAAAIQKEVGAASAAGAKYLLSLIQTAPELSEVETRMLAIKGTAAALQGALEDLGLSSQSAASAISNGVKKAIDELKTNFTQGLTARLNVATGQSYLNDTIALLAQRQQDIADAAALGLDLSLVNQVFTAEAQKIVDDADLVGSAFSQFTTLFPELSGVVTQSNAAMKRSAEELQSFIQGVTKTITAYLQSLKTGSSSILSPRDQLTEAQSYFQSQLALAQGGNRDALSGITQTAQTLLDAAKGFYASSAGYVSIYDQVTSALQGLSGISGSTVASADAQAIVAAVNTTTAAVNTTGASNDNLTAAQNALQAAQNALAAQQVTYLQVQYNLLGAINQLTADNNFTADRIINALNGLGRITQQASQVMSDELMLILVASGGSGTFPVIQAWPGFQAGGRIPGYETGGMVGNGIYGIDSVIARYAGGGAISLAGGEYVMPADKTSMFLGQLESMRRGGGPSNDNGAHFAALGSSIVRALGATASAQISAYGEEMRALRGDINRLIRAVEGTKSARRPGTKDQAA